MISPIECITQLTLSCQYQNGVLEQKDFNISTEVEIAGLRTKYL